MNLLQRKLSLCLPFWWMASFPLVACSFSYELPPSSLEEKEEKEAEPTVSTFAGNPRCIDDPDYVLNGQHQGGYVDGPGNKAQFNEPMDIALDAAGNLYVTDSLNFRIRKITPEGMVSTFAGNGTRGHTDGAGTAAQFGSLNGIAIDRAGNLYVTDDNCIRKITPEGEVSTFVGGSSSGDRNGTGTEAQFSSPCGLAIDADGTLYVADMGNHRIRKISPTGEVSTLAGSTRGLNNDVRTAAQFDSPVEVVIGPDSNLYVADYYNQRIRKVTLQGVVSTFVGGKYGVVDGVGADAGLRPDSITTGVDGNFYLADSNYIRKLTMEREVTTIAGSTHGSSRTCAAPHKDGPLTQARFSSPRGIAAAPNGDLYVADTRNHRIRKITWNRQAE